MTAVMKNGEHYGTIPGCGNKPTLLQPGAEKLAMTFKLAPDYTIDERDMEGGHREYVITCRLMNTAGALVGTGVGSCSTMESKYRYRNVADYEVTDEAIPKDAKERKAEYRKQGYGMKKVDGDWCWVQYKDSAKTENPDIADTYNTVLKMAKKRAFVDAVKSTTAASDIFTQDIEDLPRPESAAPATATEPAETVRPKLRHLLDLANRAGWNEKRVRQESQDSYSADLEDLTPAQAAEITAFFRAELANQESAS